ncbi:TPA: hypothetical protein VCC33_002134 [Kluyvera cryocrescens]|uniref:hypothetical protein n=1 Tax=Kluyvera cryocrescens TaxID=580 RepID=UPI000D900419|nr:hypothetical protein [Kluyvera cryocrescens]SQC33639.1 Uncharacterised protein [Kluyvera cryocrescens]HEP1896350.1 hypothetical protein [Kluyvera cryocrescens]
MAKRGDSSAFVYHWIKSNRSSHATTEEKYEDAFGTLILILNDLILKSGRSLGHRFGHSCICFTETPVWFMSDDKSKYQPFGFEFYKNFIYKIGGQHVIYCSEESSRRLPSEDLWKWVRHEPLVRTQQAPYGIDFSWEREIRVNRSELEFMGANEFVDGSSPGNVNFAFTRIYVPSPEWKEKLLKELSVMLNTWLNDNYNKVDDYEYEWLKEFYADMLSEYDFIIECIS